MIVAKHEAPVAKDIRSALLRYGYAVAATAKSESEALEAVETHRPDLVVMDVRLDDDGDGIAAAAAIHARHPTPIVFLTSQSDEATLMRAKEEAQPHGWVLRPYQDAELRAAIEVALQRHTLEQQIGQQRSLLAGVLAGMTDAVVATDIEGRVVLLNDAGRRAFGERVSLGQGGTNGGVFLPDQVTPCPIQELPLARALRGETVRDMELFIRSAEYPDGRWYSLNATPLLGSGGLVRGAVAVGRDVTDLRAARWELQQLAHADGLTGAYNRSGFMQVARVALERAKASGRTPAVFFIDLNGMKNINDSLGHQEGDRLLVDVTSILRSCFRTSDIIGRLGGDEFVVLAPDAGEQAESLRARLRSAVDTFNADRQRSYRMSIAIGLGLSDPEESSSLEDLVRQADRRMYEDKQLRNAGRDRRSTER